MASARSLTGGTNDVNPQPLRCRAAPSTFATITTGIQAGVATVALPIPVQRLSTGGRAQVLEILGWSYDIGIAAVTSSLLQIQYAVCLSNRSNGTTVPVLGSADPYTVDYVVGNSAATLTAWNVSGQRNLTDSAGHGVLFGQDTLYVLFQGGAATAVAATANAACNICIWYRWKNVGFTEYVGMVTSS